MPSEHPQVSWQSLSDEELLRRTRSGHLDEVMQQQAETELKARGLPLPDRSDEHEAGGEYFGDLLIVARRLEFTEAKILAGFLESRGIPVVTGDAEFARTNPFLADATGGACLRVPASFATQAEELIEAFRRDEHALPETFTDDLPHSKTQAPALEEDGLKIFRIYRKPGRQGCIVVKEGFSWWALFFGPLWFLANGMWLNFALVLALQIGGQLYFSGFSASGNESPWQALLSPLAYAAVWILIGKFANELLGASLEQRGYLLQARVRARNTADARGMSQNPPANAAPLVSGSTR